MLKINTTKLARIGVKNIGNFKSIADDFIEFGVNVEGNEPLDDKSREFLSETIALGMSMGEAVVKKPYILTGIAMGVVGTVATSKISKLFRKKEEVMVNLGELVEVVEKSTKIEKDKLEKKSKED